MERFNALGRGGQLMLVSSVLLLIVSFFHWQEIDYDLGPLGSGSAGVSAWDDLGGILMGILTIVLIARIVARLAAVDVPIPVSFALTSAVLAFLIFAIALIKNLTDDYSTFWSYIGVVLAFLVAVGAWLEIQAAGGVESLRTEATSFGSSGGAASPAPPASTAETPAPPAPPRQTAAPQEPASPAERPPSEAPPAAPAPGTSREAPTDEPSTEREP
jgi:hypothetical protein